MSHPDQKETEEAGAVLTKKFSHQNRTVHPPVGAQKHIKPRYLPRSVATPRDSVPRARSHCFAMRK